MEQARAPLESTLHEGAYMECDLLVTVVQESQERSSDRVRKIHYAAYLPQTQSPRLFDFADPNRLLWSVEDGCRLQAFGHFCGKV